MEFNKRLPSVEDVNNCPVCNSSHKTTWCNATDLLTQLSTQKFIYSTCDSCGVLYMSHRPLEEDVAYFYRGDYHPYQQGQLKDRPHRTRLSKVKCWVKQKFSAFNPNANISRQYRKSYHTSGNGLSFLDFGCGAGKQLDHLAKFNWKTVGVDFSPIAVDNVLKKGHHGYLVNQFFNDQSKRDFDLVRMNHVVEHLYHPKEVLAGISEKMRPGATLHIAVPNPAGISAKLFRCNWHGLDCPRHVILYSPEAMTKLLQDSGFSNFKLLQEAITKDFVRSLGYMLAKCGIIKLEKVQGLINSRLLAALFFIPMFLISKAGFGDRYHIFCQK